MNRKILIENYSHENKSGVFGDRYVSLAEACLMFPNGKVSRASLERWWRTGVRGAVLQTFVIGHRRYTTLTAIKKFVEDQQAGKSMPPEKSALGSYREREIDKAEANVRRQLGQ